MHLAFLRPPLRVTGLLLAATLLVSAAPAPAPAPKPPPHGHYVSLRGIRMYYESHGSGPVLLLLHGGAGNGQQFSHQIPAFAPHYRLIVPDACGQGRTSDRDGPLTYHAMAEDVIALLDKLDIDHADLMGWSDGGNIGLDIAIHHPGRLKHLVTFGANFRRDGLNPADVAWNDTATVAAFGDGMRKGWQELAPDPSRYDSVMGKILTLWRTQPDVTHAQLGAIRARTMICAGEHDLIRRDHSEALAKAIPGATLWIVPGASHGAMIEKPELVNPRVLEFLAKQ